MVAEVHKPLEQYALEHYEQGGHWVYECFGDADYAAYLAEANGSVRRAKAALKAYWMRVVEQSRECAW